MERHKVKILPSDVIYIAEHDENLLDFALRVGIHLNGSCGGFGTCGRCKVKLIEGNIEFNVKKGSFPIENEYILACQSVIKGDATIEVPLESQIDRSILKDKKTFVLSPSYDMVSLNTVEPDPQAIKLYIELEPPQLNENIDDLSRIIKAIKRYYPQKDIIVNLNALKRLPSVLRSANWCVTVTLADVNHYYELINIEPKDTTDRQYAIALDIGTTTICGRLIALGHKGKKFSHVLEEASDYNAQISYGDDVITRIMHSKKRGGLKRLQEAVITTINNIINELLEKTGVQRQDVLYVVAAGNTTMTHLFLGVEPDYLMLEPYTPCFLFPPLIKAKDIGIELTGESVIYLFPSVASYVGGDIVSGIIGSGLSNDRGIILFIDIGTNGEIVLTGPNWMLCASCSAGPAFEGGGIKNGMRATKGAIEQIRIDPITLEPTVLTIGHTKPLGICGSGLIDCVAEMYSKGIITQKGKINKDIGSKRLREVDGIYEYVICYGEETKTGKDITITEPDLDNILRAKAAMFAGCKVLLDIAGVGFNELDRIVIAGGFGHFIDPVKAQIIGLLPELPTEKFRFVGNASLHGASLYAISRRYKDEAERVANLMTHIELSHNNNFMDEFIAAMFLPHTDERLFSNTYREIKDSQIMHHELH